MKYGREVAVLGVGLHPFGKFPNKFPQEIGAYAVNEALKDAGMDWKDIQGITGGTSSWLAGAGELPSESLAQWLGAANGIPAANLSNACATGGASLATARMMVASGQVDIAMATGVDIAPKGFYATGGGTEKKTSVNTLSQGYLTQTGTVSWANNGASNPAYWAIYTSRRMAMYGTTEEDLALAKVISSRHAQYNPYARYRRVYTMEEVLNSPYVCWPLKLFEICATSDGASAVILGSIEEARKRTTHPIILAGVGVGSKIYGDPLISIPELGCPLIADTDVPDLSESVAACQMAYAEAGVGPEDLDVVELPDNSSWHYFAYMEAEGLCKPGEAEILVREGQTALGGRIPINPSGGPSCMGEAFPATGQAQAIEIVWQLRGEAEQRQVEGAKCGLGQVYGASGNNAVVVLKK